MQLEKHSNDHACDCRAHQGREAGPASGPWAAFVPVLACLLCPACLTTYAKLSSVLGVGFGLSDVQHVTLLAAAVCASIGVSAWRSWTTRRRWPIATAITGALLVAIGHFSHDLHSLEWAGVLVLLSGGLTEHLWLRVRRGTPAAAPA